MRKNTDLRQLSKLLDEKLTPAKDKLNQLATPPNTTKEIAERR